MAIAFVQQVGNLLDISNTAINPATVPISSGTTAGNTLVMAVRGSSGHLVTSVTDSQGNTWTIDKQTSAAGVVCSVCSALLVTALTTSDTITVNTSATSIPEIVVYEYSGIATSSRVDQTGATNNATHTSGVAWSITAGGATTVANELAFAAVASNTNETMTAGGGFTAEGTGAFGPNGVCDGADLIITSSGTTATMTWTQSATNGSSGVIVTYVPASGSTNFTQTFTATLSFTGVETLSTSRTLTGGLSFTGVILKQTSKNLAGGLSFTGKLLKQTAKKLTGGLSFSGKITRAIKKLLKAGLSFTGVLTHIGGSGAPLPHITLPSFATIVGYVTSVRAGIQRSSASDGVTITRSTTKPTTTAATPGQYKTGTGAGGLGTNPISGIEE